MNEEEIRADNALKGIKPFIEIKNFLNEIPDYKSEIIIEEGIIIRLNRKFNWLNRLMIKLILGIEVRRTKDE